jgi:eukaryotic-like serine/threonine-protein kinase
MNIKAQKVASHRHLSPAEFDLLLSGCEANDKLQEAATHLDSCEVCQSRLTTLAADKSGWSDAQSFLSGDDEPRWEPDVSQVDVAGTAGQESAQLVHDQVLRLLGTPNHPEMLGRLGRYDIERIIGSGGMGIVLKAHDSELNRPIAIKLLAPELSHSGAARERFAREGRAAAAVVHEHVVAIYNVESGGPVPFLVMQYVPGRSLEARVAEDGPLEVEELLRIGAQAASGLAAAHRQGLVHRDVKPANILLENSVERAILTDFGLARAIDDASLTRTGILAGTPHYMSPEQARGNAVDHRSDLFSLGSVLYFMATGHPPFRGSTAMGVLQRICQEDHRPAWQVNKDIPDELSDVIDRLLAKKLAQRFASADDVQEALASLLSRLQRDGLGRRRFRGWRRTGRRWKAACLAGAFAVCCATVAGIWWAVVPPPLPMRVETSPASIDERQMRELDADFVNGLGATIRDLRSAGEDSRFLRSGDDAWGRELEGVRRELGNLEAINGKPVR